MPIVVVMLPRPERSALAGRLADVGLLHEAAAVLPDGRYDAFIVDVSELHSEGADRWSLDLTIVSGDQKGNVVSVSAQGLQASEMELIGMPATLVVDNGVPSVSVDN